VASEDLVQARCACRAEHRADERSDGDRSSEPRGTLTPAPLALPLVAAKER